MRPAGLEAEWEDSSARAGAACAAVAQGSEPKAWQQDARPEAQQGVTTQGHKRLPTRLHSPDGEDRGRDRVCSCFSYVQAIVTGAT